MLGLFPPSSNVSFLRFPARGLDDQLADLGRAGEGHLVDVVMGGQCGAGGLAESGHHVDHAVGQPGLGDELGQPQRRQRGLLRRLEHHGAPVASAGPSFHAAISSGKFHGMIWPTTPMRLAQGVGVEVGAGRVGHRDIDGVALDLGGPAGHVVEQVGGQRHVGRLSHRERLAVVQGLQLGQLFDVLEDQVADPPDDPAAIGGGHAAPGTVFEGPRAARTARSMSSASPSATGPASRRWPGWVSRMSRPTRRPPIGRR